LLLAVGSNVAQLLAFPAGKAWEKVMPSWSITLFGNEISLNPGQFNMKEHMVITIMANVGFNAPYTNYVVFVQYVPRMFNMPWASNFGYQILIGLYAFALWSPCTLLIVLKVYQLHRLRPRWSDTSLPGLPTSGHLV
jgi:hypothetical protein